MALNFQTASMASNVYIADLWFTNVTSGVAQPRRFTLRVDQDLVHDGGFESYDFSYWTVTGPDIGNDVYVDDGTYTGYTPHSGLYFAALGESNTVSYLSESLPTSPGVPYLVSFWLANPSGSTPTEFEVEFDTAAATNVLYSVFNLSTFEWANLRYVAVGASTNSILQFAARDDFDFLTLDDVSVTPVPLPAIQGIVPSGGALQLSWFASPGLQYQVQYTPSLLPLAWSDAGSPVTAAGDTASSLQTISTNAQGYYRIVLLPPVNQL
jgi:hypothetical protein